MAQVNIENWTHREVQFRFLYPEGLAPGSLPKDAPVPAKMRIPPGATAFVWRVKTDDNPHWMPTEKVNFDEPLKISSSTPVRIVLKIPLKIDGVVVDSSNLPPTPVHKKLRDTHGPKNASAESYRELVEHLKKTKKKFVDGSFDLSKQNLTSSKDIEWVRPGAICDSPRLFPPETVSKTSDADEAPEDVDLRQGKIGNCWFIATLAMLYAFDRNLLFNLIVEYRPKLGIVLCRFCKEGEWKYVLIDDRLPIVGSQLCYAHHDDSRVFWGALLEKAYAKLHGGYDQIVGGRIQYASTDLTGHFSDNIDLARWRREADADHDGNIDARELQTLVKRLLADREKHRKLNIKSMGGCSIRSAHGEKVLESGLIAGHAYSILRERTIKLKSGEEVPLIELRNPWGQHEFNGEWSDKDERWKDPFIQSQIDFKPEEDGSFWMSLETFLKTFDDVYTTPFWHSSEGNVFVDVERGEWIAATSGGCGAEGAKAWARNPQYQIHWERENKDQSLLKVFLYQEDRIWKDEEVTAQEGARLFPAISVQVWKQECNGERIEMPLKTLKVRTPPYTRSRHIVIRLDDLPMGTYVLVPTTYKSGELGQFVLGICCSERVELEHLEQVVEKERKEKNVGTYARRRGSLDVDGSFFGDNVSSSPRGGERKKSTAFFKPVPVAARPPSPPSEDDSSVDASKDTEDEEEEEEEEEEEVDDEAGDPVPTPASKKVLVPGGHKSKLKLTGTWDKNTVLALQLYMNAMWDTATKWRDGARPHATGTFGVETIKSLQSLMISEGLLSKKKVDGRADAALITAVAKFLNARWSRARPPGRSRKLRATTETTWPTSVIKSVQHYLNNTLTGKE